MCGTGNKDPEQFIIDLTNKFSDLVSQNGLEGTTITSVIDTAAQYLQEQGIGDRCNRAMLSRSQWQSPIDTVIEPTDFLFEDEIKKMISSKSGHGISSTKSEFEINKRQDKDLENYNVNSIFQ